MPCGGRAGYFSIIGTIVLARLFDLRVDPFVHLGFTPCGARTPKETGEGESPHLIFKVKAKDGSLTPTKSGVSGILR